MWPIKNLLRALILIAVPFATAQAQQSNAMSSYKCMGLKNVWNGEGSMPPPVLEYAGPSAGAASAGIASAILIVDNPLKITDGRVRVIRPNGEVVWIDRSQITPWHVVSNPSAVCSVSVLPNGTLQATSH